MKMSTARWFIVGSVAAAAVFAGYMIFLATLQPTVVSIKGWEAQGIGGCIAVNGCFILQDETLLPLKNSFDVDYNGCAVVLHDDGNLSLADRRLQNSFCKLK